jgi:hypothetical protein
MSAQAIAKSSLRTSLLRYQRSWGLWLLLLVAPVGARFMISDEDGKGVAIAIGGQLPVLTSPMLGVWLGIVVTTLLLPIGYIYLRSNTTRKQPWQIEEVTAGSRIAIMLGRFGADVAVLLAMLATLTVAGWFLGWLMVSGPLNLWSITYALWLVAAPALIGLAAIRIFFDAVPLLRRGLGDFLYFVLWMMSLVMPIAGAEQASSFRTNMFDFPGFISPLTAGAPADNKDIAIGGVEVKAGRIPLDVSAGLNAPGYAASRMAWVGIALLLVIMAGALYRPHKQPKRMATQGRIAKLLSAGPPPPANPAAAPAMRATMPWFRLAIAEFRLIGAGRAFKIMALACAVAGVVPDYRHIGSPAALLLLIFALSAHAGRSEARGLLALTGTVMFPPMARRIGFVIAGIAWSVLLAVPAGIATLSAAPLSLALATGAIAAIIAITLGSVSRSAFAGRIILLILWYGYFSS